MRIKYTIQKKQLIVIALFFISFISQAQVTVIDSIFSGGTYRNYRLYIPAIFTGATARPLIVNMHGYTSNAFQQQYYSNFMPVADTANFLMVFPNGTHDLSGNQYWNAGISPVGADDIEFISNLIDSLKAQYNIDLNAVYSTGMSNGGFMSHTLACELSNRITAIASVTGSIFTTQFGSLCHPTRPVPVMQIHGTTDPTVPYNGSVSDNMVPIDSVVKYWVKKNGCSTVPSFSNVPNINIADACTAEHYRYLSGYSESSVELYKIIGGGHTWPGFSFGGVASPGTNLDFDAATQIWRFFRQYKLDKLVSISQLNKNPFSLSVFPNPAHSILNIESPDESQTITSVQIQDVFGKVVLSQTEHVNSISIEYLATGVYFVSMQNENKEVFQTKFIKE